MIRANKIANINLRRTIRPQYESTQATPHACKLSSTFNRASGNMLASGVVGTANAGKAAIWPGAVANLVGNETVTLAGASSDPVTTDDDAKPFGLFANFVGGELDELYGEDEVTVWRGGGTFQILAPAFNASGLPAAVTGVHYLEAGTDGRMVYHASAVPLGTNGAGTARVAVARLINVLGSKSIVVDLLV